MTEKRKFYRWDSDLTCNYESESARGEGRVVDLSYDGACIADASAWPAEGADILLTLKAKGNPCALRAHVVFTSKDASHQHAYFGVQFYDSAEERRGKLLPLFKRYLDKEE